jgi:Protein of unknown function (DUF2852)
MATRAWEVRPGVPGAGRGPTVPGRHPDGTTWYWHARYANRPLWIIATLLGLIFWWPVGLILLVFALLGGRRMSCWGYGRHDGYEAGWQGGPPPWIGWKRQWKRQMREWCRGQAQGAAQAQAQAYPPSGNRAFDEYRTETLRRLEEEQKEFAAYLERLRFAKDKAEFDQFMSELRNRPPAQPEPPQA